MIAEELKLVIKAEVNNAITNMQRFSNTTAAARNESSRLESRLKQFGRSLLAAGGIVFGFHQLAAAIKSSIAEYQKQETAEAKLSAAIRATGNEGLISAKAIGKLASELQKTTTFADDVTISAAAMLQQLADLDEQGLKQIIPRVQNFAAAMGVDLETAATLVGKTLGSTTNALSRYGIQIDATASKNIKLTELTEELDKKFGGMAETLGTTTTGQITILQNALSDLKETAGEVFLKGIGPMVQAMIPLFQRMNDAIGGTRFSKSILSTEGFQEAISSFGKAKQAIEAINDEIKRTEGLMKTQGRYVGTEKARVELLKNRRTMIEQILPLLELMNTSATDEVAAAKKSNEAYERREKAAAALVLRLRALAGNTASMENRNDAAVESFRKTIDVTENLASNLAGMEARYESLPKAVEKATEEVKDFHEAARNAVTAIAPFAEAIGMMAVDSEKGWEAFKEAAKDAISSVLRMLAEKAFVESLASFAALNIPGGIAWAAAGTAALIASGVVKALGEGGIVTQPTHALIGEKGPEAVIPLNKMGGMGGNIMVIVNGSVMEEEGLARRIGAIVARQRRGY